MTGTLCVQPMAFLIRRPEYRAWLAALTRDAHGFALVFVLVQVLVNLAGAPAVLGVATIRRTPVQWQVLRALAYRHLQLGAEPQDLALGTRTLAEYFEALAGGRPVHELPGGGAAGIPQGVRPRRSNHKSCTWAEEGEQHNQQLHFNYIIPTSITGAHLNNVPRGWSLVSKYAHV